ncbi:MAG: 30S ribosomal protein S20 [Buchnera aphidicola (Pentalonia nigronervosa)]|jgi:small subunit ribosomal protein S20|uniref:Small ribosomal subunit protein bS20 n=1 Tax=Buchnera aphidicola (Pentalonia nigronervosa) TaxID=1309793 RepID=A0A7H1AZH4_9GAMM|nr:MAG: 30S ribosomal protein S20 [Buchnera aphidicola (Pentalonia nigronervosa)]
MANIKSSKKHAFVSEKRRMQNASRRSMVRTFIKKVCMLIDSKKKELAQDAFKKMQSVIDKHVSKGLIHKNKAARYKSNLSLKISRLHRN